MVENPVFGTYMIGRVSPPKITFFQEHPFFNLSLDKHKNLTDPLKDVPL